MSGFKTVNVLIIIEHAARELEMACLIKHFLNKKGYIVEIESVLPNKERLIFKYKADVILVPWWNRKQDNLYWESFRLNNKKAIFINLNQETYTSGKEVAIIPILGRKGVFQLSWGSAFTKALQKRNVEKEKILQTGSVRLDFYRQDFIRKFAKTKAELAKEFNLDSHKDWILYIANPRHLFSTKDQDKEMGTQAIIQCRRQFLHDIEDYLISHKNHIIIYRPHPNLAWKEKEQPEIRRLLNKFPLNFVCIEAHSIRDWIVNAKICISVNSTSFVECIWANVPYVLYTPFPIKVYESYEWFSHFPYILKDKKELFRYLDNNYFFDFEVCKKILNQYYDPFDNKKLAAEKLSDAIEKKLKEMGNSENYKRRYDFILLNKIILTIKIAMSSLAKLYFIRTFFLRSTYKPFINVSIKNEASLAIRRSEEILLKKIEYMEL